MSAGSLELSAEARQQLAELLEVAARYVENYRDELRNDVENGDGNSLDAYEGAKETAAELRRVLPTIRVRRT